MNPFFNFSNNNVQTFTDDKSGTYAEATAQVLTFQDVRSKSNKVSFKAFLNSFSQNFVSNWNTEQVMGRMDEIATFKNTTRSISVSWEIAATDLTDARVNLERCSALIKLLYPTYKMGAANTMSKAPFVRISYANLISEPLDGGGLFGYITNLTWTPILEMGYFHTGKDIYPKVITISCEFVAIHDGEAGETGYFEGADEDFGIDKVQFPFRGTKL